MIEPLSLDEAYLDVSENKTGSTDRYAVARTIREQIRRGKLSLSIGGSRAPTKFLRRLLRMAKTGWTLRHQPERWIIFVPLACGPFARGSAVTEEKLRQLSVETVEPFAKADLPTLGRSLGRYGSVFTT